MFIKTESCLLVSPRSIHLAACHLVRYVTAAVINAFGIFRITTNLPLLKKKSLFHALQADPSLYTFI